MTLFAMTGGIGCGKSTVCTILEERFGVRVINTDALARQLLCDMEPALIEDMLGTDVTTKGVFDRSKFLPVLFANRKRKAAFERAFSVHLWKYVETKLLEATHDLTVVESAVLFEAGLEDKFAHVILAICPLETRLHRLMHERDLTRSDALYCMRSQMPEFKKKQLTQLTIDTACPLERLPLRVENLYQQMCVLANPESP